VLGPGAALGAVGIGCRVVSGAAVAPLPEAAYAVALAGLPLLGWARLAALLEGREPRAAWRSVLAGRGVTGEAVEAACRRGPGRDTVAEAWRRAAARVDVAALWSAHVSLGIGVHLRHSPGYPAALAGDAQAPAVLFSVGRMEALDAPRVAIIGTRRCTHYGREVAAELGHDLAAAGVGVVSGLAYGIDGAAHNGACAATHGAATHVDATHGGATGGAPHAGAPIGMVASGLDVIYPPRHAQLWRSVGESGVLLSEAPLGTRPDAWRFPTRNRLIAALGQALVVVESHAGGGSMHTVEAAIARSRPILAVPGSVHSPASVGTNQLLADGCHPVRDAGDVLVALGLDAPVPARGRRSAAGDESGPDADVLGAVGWEPTALDVILDRTGRRLGDVALALDRLVERGVVRTGGGWWERVNAPGRRR